jgi:hypothetical protein
MKERFERAIEPSLLGAAFVALTVWSWGKWADVQVDFGSELYVAWRLAEGDVLYRDIAYRNGPLSPYLNAAWFSLFGVSIRTLVLCNLLLFAGLCALVYRFFARLTNHVAGAVASLVLVCTFGFSQYTAANNYNYATPYDHAQTHGLILSVAMIALLCRGMERPRPSILASAGLCLGLVFLTKIELFLPALAAAALALVLGSSRRDATSSQAGPGAWLFAAMALLPAAVSFLLLGQLIPLGQAVQGTLGNWSIVGAGLLDDVFYQRVMGTDEWPGHLLRLVLVATGIGSAGLVVALVDRASGARGARLAPFAAAALFVLLFATRPGSIWIAIAFGLPLVSLCCAVYFTTASWRNRVDERGDFVTTAGLAVWSLFALGALGKMLLNARIGHYGFVLAMPAALLLAVLVVWLVPRLAKGWGGPGVLSRWIGIALIASWIVFWLQLSNGRYEHKSLAVGTGGDRIWVEPPPQNPKGQRVRQALEQLDALMPPEATLLVLPEGASLNYWLKRKNPSRFNLFLPSEFDAFGTDNILDDIRANPPDYVVLMDRDHRQFGVSPFGEDPRFGRSLMQWVDAHYQREGAIGPEPFEGRGFGIAILRRTDANASTP